MPSAGFEPTILATEWLQTYTSRRLAIELNLLVTTFISLLDYFAFCANADEVQLRIFEISIAYKHLHDQHRSLPLSKSAKTEKC